MQGAPSCASSRRVDSIANVPRRAFGVSFAVTLKGRLASPWPLDRSSTSQDASELIVQLHSRALVTAMLPAPPVCGNERGDGVADTPHFVALGAVVEVDADVQPVTKRTRPANAAMPDRTPRQAQMACQSDRRHSQDVGCSRETDAPTRRRRLSRFLTSVVTHGPPIWLVEWHSGVTYRRLYGQDRRGCAVCQPPTVELRLLLRSSKLQTQRGSSHCHASARPFESTHFGPRWRWPRVGDAFYKDISELRAKVGMLTAGAN